MEEKGSSLLMFWWQVQWAVAVMQNRRHWSAVVDQKQMEGDWVAVRRWMPKAEGGRRSQIQGKAS